MTGRGRKAIYWLLMVLVAVALLELVLQGVIFIRGINAETGLSARYRHDPLTDFALNPGFSQDQPYQVRITGDGARRTSDPLPDGEAIVVMGGSTTYCLNMDDEQTWPSVLEDRLRGMGHAVNVVNLGVPAQHSNHHVARFARDVAPRRPSVLHLLSECERCLLRHPGPAWRGA